MNTEIKLTDSSKDENQSEEIKNSIKVLQRNLLSKNIIQFRNINLIPSKNHIKENKLSYSPQKLNLNSEGKDKNLSIKDSIFNSKLAINNHTNNNDLGNAIEGINETEKQQKNLKKITKNLSCTYFSCSDKSNSIKSKQFNPYKKAHTFIDFKELKLNKKNNISSKTPRVRAFNEKRTSEYFDTNLDSIRNKEDKKKSILIKKYGSSFKCTKPSTEDINKNISKEKKNIMETQNSHCIKIKLEKPQYKVKNDSNFQIIKDDLLLELFKKLDSHNSGLINLNQISSLNLFSNMKEIAPKLLYYMKGKCNSKNKISKEEFIRLGKEFYSSLNIHQKSCFHKINQNLNKENIRQTINMKSEKPKLNHLLNQNFSKQMIKKVGKLLISKINPTKTNREYSKSKRVSPHKKQISILLKRII